MTNAVASVVVAAAQSVAKVYVIGGVGYAAVKYPKKAPLLPEKVVSTVARFCFNALTIPLIFSTIASSVTIDSIGDYWFVLVGAFWVLGISFVTATLLARIFIPIHNPADYNALRIACTFPNIVALPILIFPSLCEYEVVYAAFGTTTTTTTIDGMDNTMDRAELLRQCVAKSNTMIFCYFFGWSLLFWSFGHPVLMDAARKKRQQSQETNSTTTDTDNNTVRSTQQSTDQLSMALSNTGTGTANGDTESLAEGQSAPRWGSQTLSNIQRAIRQTFTSPPFIAMILAFVVACIGPVRDLLFSPGGQLRFLGAALETLGKASSPMSTMVVAASLASRQKEEIPQQEDGTNLLDGESNVDEALDDDVDDVDDDGGVGSTDENDGAHADAAQPQVAERSSLESDKSTNNDQQSAPPSTHDEETPVMSDPNFGPLHLRRPSSISRFRSSIRRSSIKAFKKARRTPPEQRRLYLWFTLSKLIVSPALVVLTIVGLDCSGVLASSGVPDLAKLVLIVNSSVPGALIVVVLLKSNPKLHETAAIVAKVYFPTYLISIVTIAAWTAVGLIVSIPDEDGNSFCAQWQ